MASITDVAKYILEKFPYGISTMKLQKLTFFAQGWALALLGQPLFEEEFQAWTHGPVSPVLFQYHRGKYALESQTFTQGNIQQLDQRERTIIDLVVQNYGALSGPQLGEMSHASGTPWASTRKAENLGNGDSSRRTIEKELISSYFKSTLAV